MLEKDAPFYFSAEDYLNPDTAKNDMQEPYRLIEIPVKRKRPTRGEGRVAPSYAELDSEDEVKTKAAVSEVSPTHADNSHLHKWVHHLTLLYREEDAKVRRVLAVGTEYAHNFG